MPMTSTHLQTSAAQNARVVPVEPEVKSSKTFKLSLRGVSAKAGSAKITDPSCYDSVTVDGTGLFEILERTMPRIGDVRFVVEHIDGERFEKLARKRGWKDGQDGMLDYAEHNEAAVYSEHKTLDEAKAAANAFLADGKSLFGCCTIDRQVFERFEDDMYPEWERHETYEVAMDGELMKVAA